ncbi:MAG: DJ-1/PfpI family protein [Candidatus Micrarchaeia archaeon]
MKKVVMVIAPVGFRDEELLIPKRILERAGIHVDIASTKKGACKGMLGNTAEANLGLSDINVSEYDAVMFVGGQGTPIIRKEDKAIEVAREAYVNGKIVSAICWAPTTLAKAGLLKGKKATVWVGDDPEYGKSTPDVLRQYGAKYVNESVVEDGNIVTADGPRSAEEYANVILRKLMKK